MATGSRAETGTHMEWPIMIQFCDLKGTICGRGWDDDLLRSL